MATNATQEFTCAANMTSFNVTEAIIFRDGLSFDRAKCLQPAQAIWDAGTEELKRQYLAYDKTSGSVSGTREDIHLSTVGCSQLCGPKIGWYADSASRLLKWFLPIIILLANFQFSPVGRKRYLSIFHLLGNPISSTSSFLLKMERWNESFAQAQSQLRRLNRYPVRLMEYEPVYGTAWIRRPFQSSWDKDRLYQTKALGVVIDAVKEVCGYLHLPLNIDRDFDSIFGDIDNPEAQKQIAEAAQDLIGSRTYEIRRTILSIILYILQVLAEFVKKLGAGSGPSGVQLGPAMLLSWILPNVLLSNVVGDYVSENSCLRIVSKFLEARNPTLDPVPMDRQQRAKILYACLNLPENYHADLAYLGAMSTIHLDTELFQQPDRQRMRHYMVASFPVVIASVNAFAVLSTPPSYFSCRHWLVIGIFLSWILSPVLSHYITRYYQNKHCKISNSNTHSLTRLRSQFLVITIKDACIATIIIILLILSSCGLFNTCTCWIGLHRANLVARINPLAAFRFNIDVMYPIVVYVCLGFQGMVLAGYCVLGGNGLRMVWWNGEEGRTFVEGWVKVCKEAKEKIVKKEETKLEKNCMRCEGVVSEIEIERMEPAYFPIKCYQRENERD